MKRDLGHGHGEHDAHHPNHVHTGGRAAHHDHGDPHAGEHGHEHPHHHEHEHDHAHGHGEGDEHGHEHGHGHEYVAGSWREDLQRGAGAGKVLFLDAPSGLAGDMIIAALVDLGVPPTVIAEAAAALPISGYHLHFGTATKSGIVASKLDVHLEAEQPERTYRAVRQILDESSLSAHVKALAHSTFRRLAEAEAKVHRSDLDSVHFHEVGAIDALVDVVGSAAAIDWIGAEIVVSPLPMGRGFVKARHGVLPLPPPATVECLRGIPTYDGGIDFEFVTPTGAAIVGAHARRAARWPSFTPERVGWGAGTANLKDRANLLRAVLGAPLAARTARPEEETHVVIEANIDDATGELLAVAIESLLREGALDVWAAPITMKKGRPAFSLSALARAEDADRVAHGVLRETTSIGVRRYPVSRVERPRRMIEVKTAYGAIPVKVAEGPFGPPQVKPELDACLQAAEAHKVPLREVLRAALAATNLAEHSR